MLSEKLENVYVYDLLLTKLGDLMTGDDTSPSEFTESCKVNEISKLSFVIPKDNPCFEFVTVGNMVCFDGELYEIVNNTGSESSTTTEIHNIDCLHISKNLQSKMITETEIEALSCAGALAVILSGGTYGWTVGTLNVSVIYRSLSIKEESVYQAIIDIAEKFNAVVYFHTVYNIGTNTWSYTISMNEKTYSEFPVINFYDGVNISNVSVTRDVTDLTTRLYAFGGTNPLTGVDIDLLDAETSPGVYNAKTYIENYSYYLAAGYSQAQINANPNFFLKESVWRDTNYIDATVLYTDALIKLAEMAVPKVTITFDAILIDEAGVVADFSKGPFLWQDARVSLSNMEEVFDVRIAGYTINHDKPWEVKLEVANTIDRNKEIYRLFKAQTRSDIALNPKGDLSYGAFNPIAIGSSNFIKNGRFISYNVSEYIPATERTTIAQWYLFGPASHGADERSVSFDAGGGYASPPSAYVKTTSPIKLEQGEEYTLSFMFSMNVVSGTEVLNHNDITTSVGVDNVVHALPDVPFLPTASTEESVRLSLDEFSSGVSKKTTVMCALTGQIYNYVTISFTVPTTETNGDSIINIGLFESLNITGGKLSITDVQLEHGFVYTTWKENSESIYTAGVTLDDVNGFINTAIIDGIAVSVVLNTTEGLAFYEGLTKRGGLEIVNGKLTLTTDVLKASSSVLNFITYDPVYIWSGQTFSGTRYWTDDADAVPSEVQHLLILGDVSKASTESQTIITAVALSSAGSILPYETNLKIGSYVPIAIGDGNYGYISFTSTLSGNGNVEIGAGNSDGGYYFNLLVENSKLSILDGTGSIFEFDRASGLSLLSGTGVHLIASPASPNDSGDILFKNSSGSEMQRIWYDYTSDSIVCRTTGSTGMNKIWHEGNDGSGSGLDADTVDTKHASDFANASHTHSYLPLSGGTMTGEITMGTYDINTTGNIEGSNTDTWINCRRIGCGIAANASYTVDAGTGGYIRCGRLYANEAYRIGASVGEDISSMKVYDSLNTRYLTLAFTGGILTSVAVS